MRHVIIVTLALTISLGALALSFGRELVLLEPDLAAWFLRAHHAKNLITGTM